MLVATKPIPELSEKDKKNFSSKMTTIPNEKGCLEWVGGKFPSGYGVFHIGRRSFRSPRVAYFLATGEDPLGFVIRHSCNNPGCVNPVHLSTGTHQDNVNDRERSGRTARGDRSGARTKPERLARGDNHHSRLHPEKRPRGDTHFSKTNPEKVVRGECHGNAKLTESQIIAIRADTRFQREIALDYGVSQVLIGLIKRRKSWNHVI